MNSPRLLLAHWPPLRERLRRAETRVLLSDFDGTLARIRRTPESVRMPKSMRRLLERIRDAGSIVGVVSGRDLKDVESRVGIARIWYAGSHGYSLRDPRGRLISLATQAGLRQVDLAVKQLRSQLKSIRGVRVEAKKASVAVHYRNTSRPAKEEVKRIVRDLHASRPRLRLIEGKEVCELLPNEPVDKYAAIRRLLKEENAVGRRFVAYLGDDTTDEIVFRQMRTGISIFVGRRARTAARYRLRSAAEVREFLRLWLKVAEEKPGAKFRCQRNRRNKTRSRSGTR